MDNNSRKKKQPLPGNRIADLAAVIGSFGFTLPEGFGVNSYVATLESRHTPVMFRLEYKKDVGQIFLFPWVRTPPWDYDGERTDIHDIAAISFAATVTAGLDIPTAHGYEAGYCGRMEMDTVFVGLEQSQAGGYRDDDSGIFDIARIISASFFSWKALAKCEYDKHRLKEKTDPTDTGYSWDDATPWASTIARCLNLTDEFANATYSRRKCPSWTYYHDWKKRTVVVQSEALAKHVGELTSKRQSRTIDGIDGQLVVAGNCRNFVPFQAIKRATRLLRALEDGKSLAPPSFICLENRVLIGGGSHLIAIYCNSGRAAFDFHREQVRPRFEAEAELLFPATEFQWANEIPDDQFESLVCELLALENGVVRVRRSGVTRERDGGRDLIADWIVPTISQDVKVYASELSREPQAVVVQCKTSSKTVGKGKVQDIRDTVESHLATGYFLAVSSQISGPLISHLESLKRNKLFVEWWTRLEIEARLRKHPDVAARYEKIVCNSGHAVNPSGKTGVGCVRKGKQ